MGHVVEMLTTVYGGHIELFLNEIESDQRIDIMGRK